MPTPFTHAAFSLAAGRVISPKLDGEVLIAGAVLSALPDLDVIGFAFGIPYGSPLGHRGITHSIAFALLTATLGLLMLRRTQIRPGVLWAFLFVSAVTHPLLDAMTDGGLGVAFFAPFTNARYFFPFRPIAVSPIGLGFLSSRGLQVLASEFVWVWLPAASIAGAVSFFRWRRSGKSGDPES